MVSARGEVKLLDFGVVKADEGRVARTDVGVVKGNVTYMAPEQARGLDVDARADLYSLALVMFFCATGKPLYAADTTYGLLMKAGNGPGVEDRTAIRALPPALAAVIDRATATRSRIATRTHTPWPRRWKPRRATAPTATAALVVELFGAELKEEAHRMASSAPTARLLAVVRLSSASRSAPQAVSAIVSST